MGMMLITVYVCLHTLSGCKEGSDFVLNMSREIHNSQQYWRKDTALGSNNNKAMHIYTRVVAQNVGLIVVVKK